MATRKISISLNVLLDEYGPISEVLSELNETMDRLSRRIPGDKSMSTSLTSFEEEEESEDASGNV